MALFELPWIYLWQAGFRCGLNPSLGLFSFMPLGITSVDPWCCDSHSDGLNGLAADAGYADAQELRAEAVGRRTMKFV